MNFLRNLLSARNPDLFQALENAWKIAERDFFPLMSSPDDSLNSALHSKNLENYLNSILEPYPYLFDYHSSIFLTPYELYCLLMAIVFHDIGRIVGEPHGDYSKVYIEKYWEKLSIPDKELADAIATICNYHKPGEKKVDPPVSIMLNASDGVIRVWELSVLLILIDEMDTTYRRLKPLYVLKQINYISGKGVLRNSIRSVTYNESVHSVIVSIGIEIESNSNKSGKVVPYIYENNQIPIPNPAEESKVNEFIFINEKGFLSISKRVEDNRYLKVNPDGSVIPVLEWDENFIKNIDDEIKGLVESLKDTVKMKLLGEIIAEINENKVIDFYKYLCFNFPESEFLKNMQHEIDAKFSPIYIIWTIVQALNNNYDHTHENRNKEALARLGIVCESWLLCCKEHLFNWKGEETFEPIFTNDYLVYVYECMIRLSQQVFGRNRFTYDILASAVLEEDINKIKIAVKRISVLLEALKSSIDGKFALMYYDSKTWELSNNSKEIFNQMKELLAKLPNPKKVI